MSHRDITKTLTACLREGVPMIARPLLLYPLVARLLLMKDRALRYGIVCEDFWDTI